jgi:hypothetical protein
MQEDIKRSSFVNAEGVDFQNVETMKHTQEWDLVDMALAVEYKTQYVFYQ